ncbi:MAG: sialate O-acetylesterase [Verrucomicrobiae bacterium]|nr:sialate O-acetylesterase [Verrucomicrobiae bacterium]NNJ86019.1 hypothetical protein [Akkermansiaceae bacterium]
MKKFASQLTALGSVASLLGLFTITAHAAPLKVYILCGQSNMEGHAQTKTFPAIAKDPKTKHLYDKMVGPDGKPVIMDDVWIAYSYGNFSGDPVGKKSGKLTAGYGSQHHVGTGKIGPELTFGITMHELQGEPILLIKDAWGGKSLMVDFRPPSAGKLPEDHKNKDKAGRYYKLLIDHVKEVLANPKAVYPDYNAKDGYELAGFVWFQGFNDMVGPYPRKEPAKGKKSTKDYSEYSRLMACFIRDVRKDLKAPKLPFVIGALGVGGEKASEGAIAFRNAMAAPAESDEFKGNVAAVFTHKYWPSELDDVTAKVSAVKKTFHRRRGEIKKMENEARSKAQKQLDKEMTAAMDKALTKDDKWLLENGISNRGFHYHGSAKFFAQIGKAFAETLVKLEKGQ